MEKLKLIGKGVFTKCYQKDEKTVILHSKCPLKECMSFGWFPDTPLFPKLERIDYLDDGETQVYEMKYYPKVKSLKNNLKESQWKIYKELVRIRRENINTPKNHHMLYNHWQKAFKTIKNRRVKDIMLQALDACANYGSDICFEISPRNVAVDKGKLVLLDVFFMYSKLQEVRSK